MTEVAPAPVPTCFNWTGFYIGGFGGYKRSDVDLDLKLTGGWAFFPNIRDAIAARRPRDLGNDGGEAGGLIGYNYQWRCWVFGLEVGGGYLWARDADDFSLSFPANPNPIILRVHTSFKTHYLMTAAPRIGYAIGRVLPYVTGGLAVGDLDFSQAIIEPGTGESEVGKVDDTNAGWMVGGGLQYALTDHWSLRAQYEYIDLDNVGFRSVSNFGGQPTANHAADLIEHNASFAIMYKF
jgi:outer membrane immunogenic protein